MCQAWKAQVVVSSRLQPISPPPPISSSQLIVLMNHFPHQGYIIAQPTQDHAAPHLNHMVTTIIRFL